MREQHRPRVGRETAGPRGQQRADRAGEGRNPRKGAGGSRPEAIIVVAIRIRRLRGPAGGLIRRVAAWLRCEGDGSLYDHFDNKDDLLAAMAEEVAGESLIEGPMPGEWREALALLSRRVYVMLVAHPWLVGIAPIQYRRLGRNAVRSAKQYVEALEPLGLEPSELWLIAGTVNDYLGRSSHTARRIALQGESCRNRFRRASCRRPRGSLPSLPDSFRSRASIERFQRGLQIVLKGIEAELESRKA